MPTDSPNVYSRHLSNIPYKGLALNHNTRQKRGKFALATRKMMAFEFDLPILPQA